MQEQVKLIFAGKIARALLKKGYTIVDLKANKDYPDRTVFIFRNDEGLKEDLRILTTK